MGRGSFTWAAGGWTSVTQTVYLNTPGQQDGQFTLDVNGKRVMERSDVFYRDVPLGVDPPTTGDGDDGEEYLDPMLDEATLVLGDAVHTGQQTAALGPTKTGTPVLLQQALEVEPIGFIGIFFRSVGSSCFLLFVADTCRLTILSTFFGGHEAKYATPIDQYVWFNGFTMSNNDLLA